MAFRVIKTDNKTQHFLDDEQSQEMEDQVKLDLEAYKAGRKEDFLLLQAMRGNWSVDNFVSVAKRRGKSWRFVSALADKANELQGITMLFFVAETAQNAFREATLNKTLNHLERMRNFTSEYMERTETQNDPLVQQIIQDAEEETLYQSKEARHRLNVRLRRLMEWDE